MSQLDEPNVVLPLGASYNVRGMDGFTNTFTSAIDQRKVNSIYTPVTNSGSGKQTLYLGKRPGVTLSATSYGTTGQVAYLVITKPNATGADQVWVFSVSGNDVRVHDGSTTTVIVTAAGYVPVYAERMLINSVETVIVQLRNASNVQRVFYATAIGVWTEIVDADFTGLGSGFQSKLETMDGFVFALDAANRRIVNSDVNSVSSWTAGNYITKQIITDHPKWIARFGKLILCAGEDAIEVFFNAGNSSFSPLQSAPEKLIKLGGLIASDTDVGGNYYAICDQRMYFFGHDPSANRDLNVFAYDGQNAEKVSTPFISAILSSTDGTNTRSFSMYAVAWRGQRAIAIALDPVTAATQRWLMYFPDWKEWFEWNSTVFCPRTNGTMYLGVGSNQHRLYSFDTRTDKYQDDSTSYAWSHQFKLPTKGNSRKRMAWCGWKADTSRSAQSILVEKSDDDYQSWQTLGNIDNTSGKKSIYRCGSYQDRAIRLSYTGSLDVRAESFLARVA